MKYMGNSQLTNDTMLGTKYMKYRKYFEHNQTNYDIKTYQYLKKIIYSTYLYHLNRIKCCITTSK